MIKVDTGILRDQKVVKKNRRSQPFKIPENPSTVPLISRCQQVKCGHTDRYAIFHLLKNDVVRTICRVRGDLDPPIDGAGVHHHDLTIQLEKHLAGDAKILMVLAQAGEEFDVLAFELDAKDVGHITPAQGVSYIVADFYAQIAVVFWDQGWGAANPHFGPKFLETKNIAQCNPAVQDIANNGNFFACHIPEPFPDRKCIEQSLGGVFMRAVAGINDVGRNPAGKVNTGSGSRMSHHHHIYFHGEDIVHCIKQRFTFTYTAATGREVYGIGTETAFGQFERNPGTGTALKKQVSNRDIAQGRNFFDGAVDHLLKIIRRFEDELDVVFGDVFNADQVAR